MLSDGIVARRDDEALSRTAARPTHRETANRWAW